MKYFISCINPECDKHLHPIAGVELLVASNLGLPIIASTADDDEVPPLEAAALALEHLLESDVEDSTKAMASEKLKQITAQIAEEESEEATSEEPTVAKATAVADYDEYYQTAEYKAHRAQMESLEVERVKAEISNLRAQTSLVNAKARLTAAEAQKIELDLPTLKQVKPTPSYKESAELSNTVQNIALRLAAVETKLSL